jgi:hypothetical protein
VVNSIRKNRDILDKAYKAAEKKITKLKREKADLI